jgi:hypothetical protein
MHRRFEECIEGLENDIVDMTVRTTMQRGDVGGGRGQRVRGCPYDVVEKKVRRLRVGGAMSQCSTPLLTYKRD